MDQYRQEEQELLMADFNRLIKLVWLHLAPIFWVALIIVFLLWGNAGWSLILCPSIIVIVGALTATMVLFGILGAASLDDDDED